MTKTPLRIVSHREGLDLLLETVFFRNCILGGLDRPVSIVPVDPNQPFPALDNALYIVMANLCVEPVLNAVAAGRKNIGVMHFADELGLNGSWYGSVDYVLRHYWYDSLCQAPEGSRCQTVQWVPNGYMNGVGPRPTRNLLPTSQREILYFFSGYFHIDGDKSAMEDRCAMLKSIADHKIPAFIKITEGHAKGYSPMTFGSLIENSKFCFIPKGKADETIRLFDALECGSIPISLGHRFLEMEGAMQGAPIVQIGSWDQLPDLNERIHHLTADELDGIQADLIRWWSDFKDKTGRNVAETIEKSFSRYGVS